MTEVSREGWWGSQPLANITEDGMIQVACPEWCTRHDIDTDGSAIHHGQAFGHFEPSAVTLADGTMTSLGIEITGAASLDDLDDMTPEELRQLACDALAAAEWLEANR